VLTSQVVATDIVDLGVLNKSPDVRALEVLQVIVIGGAQVSDHGAVVTSDDDAAAAGRDLGVDAVLDAQASLVACLAQDGSILIVTSTANVDDAVGR